MGRSPEPALLLLVAMLVEDEREEGFWSEVVDVYIIWVAVIACSMVAEVERMEATAEVEAKEAGKGIHGGVLAPEGL